MSKKVYISGAIAHYDLEERKAAFSAAATHLRAQGYHPALHQDGGTGREMGIKFNFNQIAI